MMRDDQNETAEQMLLRQEEDFLIEFQDLCRSEEQKQFAETWIQTRYIPARSYAQDYWHQVAQQVVYGTFEVPFDEQEWEKKLAQLQEQLWS